MAEISTLTALEGVARDSGNRRPGSRISETRETTEGSAELKFRIHSPPAEMVWGRRRDFLPGSQEVRSRDGNPPTNATVPAPLENGGSGS